MLYLNKNFAIFRGNKGKWVVVYSSIITAVLRIFILTVFKKIHNFLYFNTRWRASDAITEVILRIF